MWIILIFKASLLMKNQNNQMTICWHPRTKLSLFNETFVVRKKEENSNEERKYSLYFTTEIFLKQIFSWWRIEKHFLMSVSRRFSMKKEKSMKFFKKKYYLFWSKRKKAENFYQKMNFSYLCQHASILKIFELVDNFCQIIFADKN